MTNSSAISALSTLRSINSDMEKTQSAISSGYTVEKASDNAAYWSIATTMRSDNIALSAAQDARQADAVILRDAPGPAALKLNRDQIKPLGHRIGQLGEIGQIGKIGIRHVHNPVQ